MEAAIEASVLGVRIRRRSRREALESLCDLLEQEGPHSVYFVHAATANLAFEDAAYRTVINRGHLVFNDGVGVKWAARISGITLDENLVGTDLIPDLLARPLRVYLLGGRPEAVEGAARYIGQRFPWVAVVGFGGGFFDPSEEPAVVERVRRQRPDVLLVGMGNPRQELFIDRHLEELGCKLAVGVGGLFDHFAGELRRARPWVRQLGFEWCQLLIQQPHKWRRYLLGIPKFLWRALQPKLLPWLAKGAVAAVSLSVSLATAEALVRFARPQILARYPEGLYVASPTRQYQLRPHFRGIFRYPEFETEVRINGQGLREDREYSPVHPNTRRVLALGDSFTMGYSVEQGRTWVRVLEKLLNQAGRPRRYEVINAGVPGYSTRQELAYLEEEGLALGPDLILLGFFLGNDIVDNAAPQLPVELRDGRLISAGSRKGLLPFPVRLALARHSHLYQLASRLRRVERRGLSTGVAGAGWEATAEIIGRLARACAGRSIHLIVVLMPERIQVEAGGSSDYSLPNRRMRGLCRRAGAEVVDLLDSLDGPGLYFPQDGHWTARGNAAAAEAIFAHLRHDQE